MLFIKHSCFSFPLTVARVWLCSSQRLTVLWVKIECNRQRRVPSRDSLHYRVIALWWTLQMELFVDDLVECHGDVRVRAMMVPCCWREFRLLTAALAFIAILWVSASMTVRFVRASTVAWSWLCEELISGFSWSRAIFWCLNKYDDLDAS